MAKTLQKIQGEKPIKYIGQKPYIFLLSYRKKSTWQKPYNKLNIDYI